ncbi:MAG: aromatic-ring-hydroxylating dioxygenase subunit beta [Tetrasphaera sp.]
MTDLTRANVEDFLYAETALLDEWQLEDWLALFTPDGSYQIPCNDDPGGSGDSSLMLVDDNRLRLTSRVERLQSRKAHREYPHSNLRHFVTNVRILDQDAESATATCSLMIGRFRANREIWYCGRADYALVRTGESLAIRRKRVTLDMTTLRHASDVALIL